MARRRGGGGGGGGGANIQLTITSVPILFAVLYGIMLLYYIRRAFRNPKQVFISLSLFCAIRVTAFGMYAAIFDDHLVNSDVAITMNFFLGVGFFALLYSAYVLVLDREVASGNVVKNSISRVTSNRYLICFALAAAVAIGIATYVCRSQWNMSTFALQQTYLIIFLVVTVLMGVQTVFQVKAERRAALMIKRGMPPATPSGKTHNTYIPSLILILLLIHEIYSIVMINLYTGGAALWWSLWAVPELLAVFLFATPDVVPEKQSLAPRPHGLDGSS